LGLLGSFGRRVGRVDLGQFLLPSNRVLSLAAEESTTADSTLVLGLMRNNFLDTNGCVMVQIFIFNLIVDIESHITFRLIGCEIIHLLPRAEEVCQSFANRDTSRVSVLIFIELAAEFVHQDKLHRFNRSWDAYHDRKHHHHANVKFHVLAVSVDDAVVL
jgi:hypothetical protein